MQQIMGTEQQLMEKMEAELKRILNNNFILAADEKGIKRYEQLLGLYPVPEDTLETRRAKVLNRWNNFIPYTWRVLIRRMEVICGDAYKLIPDFNNYQLAIRVWLEGCGQAEMLDHMLACVMPANMLLDSKNEITAEADTTVYTSAWVTDCEVQETMDYYRDSFGKETTAFICGTAINAEITDGSDACGVSGQKIDGTAGFGGGIVEYETFEAVQP